MMDSGAVLRDALTIVRRTMKERGFSAKRNTYYRRTDAGNILLLSVQKSRTSSPAESTVALNYGVFSARIASRLQTEPSPTDVWSAHWLKRALEGGQEKWLRVKSTDSADDCAKAIVAALDTVLPDLMEHSTDESLRDEWLSGSSPGLTEIQRLVHLAILVSELDTVERLRSVLQEVRGQVSGTMYETVVEDQLARAGIRVPHE